MSRILCSLYKHYTFRPSRPRNYVFGTLVKLDNVYHGSGSRVSHLSNWSDNKHVGLKCIPADADGSGQPSRLLNVPDRCLLFGMVGGRV